jgi:hypothetical protein
MNFVETEIISKVPSFVKAIMLYIGVLEKEIWILLPLFHLVLIMRTIGKNT